MEHSDALDTGLELASGTRTRFDDRGHVLIDAPGGATVDGGLHGMWLLSKFTPPRTPREVLEHLDEAPGFSADGVLALSLIQWLTETGALVPAGGGGVRTKGWADPVEHARMLSDERRTCDYIRAIERCVSSGDVVLDIGTGSGVLAVAAARAGARQVYAVEATDIGETAARVFAANGLQDRITLLHGWSACVDLPERADVLVSEIIGSEPLEENLLETTLDARHRLLKPGARVLPETLRLVARPLLVPEAESTRHAFGIRDIARWQRDYGIDFSPMLDGGSEAPLLDPTEGELVATWPQVGPPVTLAEFDLSGFGDTTVHATADLRVKKGGRLNAVAVTFDARLFDDIVHELDPWRWPASSWATAVWFLPEPVQIGDSESLRIQYHRAPYDTPELTCETVGAHERLQTEVTS